MKSCVVLALLAACSGSSNREWLSGLSDARVVVDGVHAVASDCRTEICVHNENTDLIVFEGATYLVHRTATSQILGPNSSLRVSRSDDHGKTWRLLAVIPALAGHDLRDPGFYQIDGKLAIKALSRLPVISLRDSDVDTITVASVSPDGGRTWNPLAPIGPVRWSFWWIRDDARGVHYTAAYEDGDKSVQLLSSTDGTHWTGVSRIYDRSEDTPLEPELVPGDLVLQPAVRGPVVAAGRARADRHLAGHARPVAALTGSFTTTSSVDPVRSQRSQGERREGQRTRDGAPHGPCVAAPPPTFVPSRVTRVTMARRPM